MVFWGFLTRKSRIPPALSSWSLCSLSSRFLLISVLTANVLPTSSCVCCLIAEPPSPRPWDPPGSMYHLLCHLFYLCFFLFLCPPHDPLPWFPAFSLTPHHITESTPSRLHQLFHIYVKHTFPCLIKAIHPWKGICMCTRVRPALSPAFQQVAPAVQCYTLVKCVRVSVCVVMWKVENVLLLFFYLRKNDQFLSFNCLF